MPRTILIAVTVAITVATTACASSTPVEPEPLPGDQKSELECLVVGVWLHSSSDDTPIPQAAQNFYHLEADGSGKIEPNEGSQEMFGMSDTITTLQWELEGRNLHLHRDDDQTDVFRIDDWNPEQMDWFYYANSMDYGVTRAEEDDIPDC